MQGGIRQYFEALFARHKKALIPITIVGGFIVDLFTLNQIDQVFDNTILITHLLIVGGCILLLFSKDTSIGSQLRVRRWENILATIMLFSFGGLFSGFVIFYGKSGSFIPSFPFLVLMLLLMLGTELYKKYYQRLVFQVAFFFVAIFASLRFFIPLIVNQVGDSIFLASSMVSLLFIALFLKAISRIDSGNYRIYSHKIIFAIGIVFVLFHLFYFTNVMPPVPLSLKFGAVYHDISRTGTYQYRGVYEQTSSLNFLRKRSHRYHWMFGERVYVFTAVFTPADLETDIIHQWEYFDREKNRWAKSSAVKIHITPGRSEGFRGFSYKEAAFPGWWRVRVTNERGQTLGFVRFKIIETTEPQKKIVEIL